MATRQQGMSETILVNLMEENKFKLANAKAKCRKIKKGKPRKVGRRVCGLQKNVPSDDQNCSFLFDAAIAELDENELQYMKTSKSMEDLKNRCPLYGFVNKGDFSTNGEIVHLEDFAETFRKEEREFAKFGRTTGLLIKDLLRTRCPHCL